MTAFAVPEIPELVKYLAMPLAGGKKELHAAAKELHAAAKELAINAIKNVLVSSEVDLADTKVALGAIKDEYDTTKTKSELEKSIEKEYRRLYDEVGYLKFQLTKLTTTEAELASAKIARDLMVREKERAHIELKNAHNTAKYVKSQEKKKAIADSKKEDDQRKLRDDAEKNRKADAEANRLSILGFNQWHRLEFH
jgi:hypothetical protein